MMQSKVYQTRIKNLQDRIDQSEIDLVAIPAGPSQVYFSGLHFHGSERPAVLLVSAHKKPAFIFPGFEAEKISQAPIDLTAFPYQESRDDWLRTFITARNQFSKGDIRVGVEPTAMRYLEMDLIGYKDNNISFTSAAEMISALRASKDKQEIESIRQAVSIAETALEKTLPIIKPGVAEKEIASELVIQLLRGGSEPELPFFPIVASGPNSANPHATPGERVLSNGDLLIIDWGARMNGYISDITRTFAIGEVSSQLQEIYQVVKQANLAARNLSQAIYSGQMIDKKAREVISDAGYGDAFLHRTGHGYGLEAHEAPYISMDDTAEIPLGATFTIEPGIYLPGVGGVRIEDDMQALNGRLETLTTLDRVLIIL